MRFVGRLIEQHLSGAFDHSAPLWQLLMFDAFLRRCGDRSENAVRPLPCDLQLSR
jgi:asparagine synthase (glutamine-hydrolysing)